MGKEKRELVQAIYDIYERLGYTDHIEKINDEAYYYENAYVEPIKDVYKEKGFRDSELKVNKYGLIRECSIASSSRLCFLRFYDEILKDGSSIKLEKKRYNDVSKRAPSYFDAYQKIDEHNAVYFEAKCQEITDAKGLLSQSYDQDYKLFREFDVTPIEKWSGEYKKIQFPISSLGITGIKDVPYNKLKFDLKQLICHLIALANDDGNKEDEIVETKTLQYLFFTPSKATIEKNDVLKKLYDELYQEIKAIWNSEKIKKFCSNHHIKLAKPEFIEIDSIWDKVYPKVNWKTSVK